MKNLTIYGAALMIGSLGMIVTMILHPTGPEILSNGQGSAHMIEVAVYVHALAIGTIPVGFLGFVGLCRYVGTERIAGVLALILYGFSNFAGMCAAVFSGFGATQVVKQMARTEDVASRQFLQAIYHYNGTMNQSFAKVMFVSLTVSIALWSVCLLRTSGFGKSLGFAGLLIGGLSLLTFLAGVLRLDVYGFGIFIFASSIWNLALGVLLIRSKHSESADNSAEEINAI